MRDPATIADEIEHTRKLLKSAESQFCISSLSVASSGRGHNDDSLDLKTDINAYKASLLELEDELTISLTSSVIGEYYSGR